MKKIFLSLLFVSVLLNVVNAQPTTMSSTHSVKLEFVVEKHRPLSNPIRPKAPEKLPTPPEAILSENVLSFVDSHTEYTLYIIDEEGEEVYEVFIPKNTSIITLPLNLSGEYELQLVSGQYCFYTNVIL
ncbi:hypothetical protein SAMN04487901_103199 [Prevotella communis]|uniref:DUF3244 domain-containing protein n=1 Tax=Prevotella communis TaxID=2913614 RepID=A0A1G7TZC1_9BACT|nr:hypothetical protein [Prevotella communis]SDG40613.1 hypothetical protein SAMN04487901_103199 [Prevotella communis]